MQKTRWAGRVAMAVALLLVPASLPAQSTVKLAALCDGASAATLLCGAVLSMMLNQIGVRMGGFTSNLISA